MIFPKKSIMVAKKRMVVTDYLTKKVAIMVVAS
jgi:hypothetical protein